MLKEFIILLAALLISCSNTEMKRSWAHFLLVLTNSRCIECLPMSQSKVKELETQPIQFPPPEVSNFQISPSSIFAYLTWQNPSIPDFQYVRILRRANTFPTSPSDPSSTLAYQGTGTEHLDGILTHQTQYFYKAYVYNGVQFSEGVQVSITTMKSGNLDTSFVPASVSNVKSVFVQADKKILVAGNSVRRLESNGNLDTSFTIGSVDNVVQKVFQHTDDKIYAVGDFTTYNSSAYNRIIRLLPDGTIDTSFGIGSGASASIFDAWLYDDGRLLIVGNFTLFNTVSRTRIARILPDGTVEASFNPGLGFTSSALNVTVQNDGRIFVTGNSFTHYNGTPRNRIARLHSDATLDAGLPVGTHPTLGPNNLVRSHFVLPDGRYLISGEFDMCNSVSVPKIARLNSDGTLDTSFSPGLGLVGTGQVWRFLRLPNSKLIIVGNFTNYGGTARNRIARLNENGSLDTDFDPGSGADNPIYDVKFTHDGRLIIGGYFTNYNGLSISGVAKVYP